jgi:hypothetical protein
MKRLFAALATGLAAGALALGGTAMAQDYPPTSGPTTTVPSQPPAIDINDDTFVPGGTVTVNYTNALPNEPVTFQLYRRIGSGLSSATPDSSVWEAVGSPVVIVADANGVAVWTFPAPSRGEYLVVATSDSGGPLTVEFTVTESSLPALGSGVSGPLQIAGALVALGAALAAVTFSRRRTPVTA